MIRYRRRHGIARGAAVAVFAFILMLVAPAPVAASVDEDVDDFTFATLDVDMELTRDETGVARAHVTETFVAEFPDRDQNRGMRRSIPLTDEGVPLHPTLVSVTDERGDARPVDTDRDEGYLVVTSAVPEGQFVHGAQTYVFTYTLAYVAGPKDNGLDELYWNLLGSEWAQPFGEVSTAVTVDASLAGALTGDARVYAGEAGATASGELAGAAQSDGSILFETRHADVPPHGAVTIAIGFDPGTFRPFDPSIGASPAALAQIGGGVLAAVGIGWSVLVRRRRLQDEAGRPVVVAEYAPPEGVDAATAAAILGRTTKIVPAEVLEQAVAGSLRIVESKGSFGRSTYTAELVDPTLADENGRIILEGLFGDELASGSTFEFGTTSSRFSSASQNLISWASGRNKALRRGYGYRAGAWPLAVAAMGVVLIFGAGVIALVSYVTPLVPILLLVLGFITVFAVLIVLGRNPLTRDGAEIRDHLLGLKQFIAWAEEDRIRMLQSPEGAERRPVDVSDPRQMLVLYERLLPFAVVFGQEKQWAERLAAMYPGEAPPWYAGSGAFSASTFAAGITSMSSATSASSSSGGSTGGGSAGGGGGGGGGGGV